MMSNPNQDLLDLARKLLKDGPYKTFEPNRRIRAVYESTPLVDTLHPLYVWEHPYYPTIWVPSKDCRNGDGIDLKQDQSHDDGSIKFRRIECGDKHTTRAFSLASGPLKDYVRIEFKAMDAWYEEDMPILVHPKDPFKRVDVLASSRHVRVSLEGHVLAETTLTQHLHETGLPVRYYMPVAVMKWSYLRKSETQSFCPYKGVAEYFDVVLPGKEAVRDLVWYYNHPNLECAQVMGMGCFYNEKVDIEIDGVKEARPKTKFA